MCSHSYKSIFNWIAPYSHKDCNAAPRQEWLERTLRRLSPGMRILDAGAGELAYKKYCSHLEYFSQDFAQYSGEGDGKGLQTQIWDQSHLDIVCDITNIPEPDSSFDAVMCIEVFEHLPDPLKALDEFFRLLKPGGILILTVPFACFTHFSPYFFCTGFSPYWYETHLISRNFEIQEITANGNFPAFVAQEVGRLSAMAQRYAGFSPTILERVGIRIVQSLCERMYKLDKLSHEFACFGYHVCARKLS
jgi:SAM-dependent methyltransferase